MQINKINSTDFRGQITVFAKENTHKKFLYNDLIAVCRKYQLPANFGNNSVEFPSISDNIIAIMKKIGIKIR